MLEQTKYRLNKIKYLLTLNYQKFRVTIFYKFNSNKDFKKIINSNREFLKSVQNFLPEEVYLTNDYGIQRRIYDQIDKKISSHPTYSDFIVFLIIKIFKENINYLEIGVSVLKNFLQINYNILNSHLIAYDINEINPVFTNISAEAKNKNTLSYFTGSVLDINDSNEFKKKYKNKFDFIFSDALHTPEAIRSEYELIIKDSLADKFIIYYDDLDFEGLEFEFSNIKLDISNNKEQKIYFYTFSIFGWIGEHEKLHKNGMITNINIDKLMKLESLKIFKFKEMN
ncbi:MAG: hypothetical protein CMC29_03440 [Flavobacteriaceae bacterium]|nr:hypothetical protein [Flavobacteriaceae bacterium]